MVYQIGATLLDACVLALVEKEDAYGYLLTQQMSTKLEVSESTLYPVLRRLQKDGFLDTYDKPYLGRNRRYYTITEPGRVRLDFFRREFVDYTTRLSEIIIVQDDICETDGSDGSVASSELAISETDEEKEV